MSRLPAITLLVVAGCCLLGAAPSPATAGSVPASQPLVILTEDRVARVRPDAAAPRIVTVRARRPLTHVRTVLPVLGELRPWAGSSWVQVRLPGRPSGRRGWIPSAGTRPASTEWHVTVELARRRVSVYRDGVVMRRFKAVIGKPSTPTPRGSFFIEEAVALSRSEAGGPYALAASARSQVLQEFAGGPGQIAIHGTGGLSGALGSASSHGCIRLSARAVTWLAARIGSGVPLTITG